MASATRSTLRATRMSFVLSRGTSFCETGGHFIFLDLAGDRYHALTDEAEQSFRRLSTGARLTSRDRAVLPGLVADGLLLPTSDDRRPVACPAPARPERSLVDEDCPVPSKTLGRTLFRLAQSSLMLKLRPLRAVLRGLEERKRRRNAPRQPSIATLVEVATAFRRGALVVAPLDQCLPSSIAVAHALLDRRCRPDLVIGVRLQPFGAHCWVQHGNIVLNESLDQVRNFTPILVV